MNRKKFTKYYFISLLVLSFLSLLLLGLLYRFEFSLENISNSLFIINIIVFSVGLIFQTGATRTFMSMSYTMKTWFKRKETKENYENFHDYYNQHEKQHKKNIAYLIFATITLIIIAAILGAIKMNI